ncbi:bacteriophage antitermination protein Q [Escherichia coli]|nr:bacteriophage antitermination protein Q [Escherichia coli]MCK2463816.1 bacteriophage antitermination protein Q [Escherichia coli]MCK2487132.1 bacteriophage antitermination protein Q [Escherichia coli]MCK2644318.1 bacteriophage antitermination protein Q [Escherichia coli]
MNTQYLQYVREQLIVATADLSGATKGQLEAWLEHAQFDTGTYKRKKPRILDVVTGKMITLDNPPIYGKQSYAKGSSVALVSSVEFSTSSWRRAILSLDEHQKAWLLWSYSENIRWEHQVAITQWAWNEFKALLGTRKIAGKTLDRLKKLIWLAAQDVKSELAGRETYEYQELALLVGVTSKNWSETFTERWVAMKHIFLQLDSEALLLVTRTRSKQKATFSQQSIAKLD